MLQIVIISQILRRLGIEMKTHNPDIVIIGAGIIGLTIANELLNRDPNLSITIIEKEPKIGLHASGRNSGVLHSGIYYPKDSLKAKVCAIGREEMINFAKTHGISVKQQGKVLLATTEEEYQTLQMLYQNAMQHQIPVEKLDHKKLHQIEPFAAFGTEAIFCPTTAVIDSKHVLNTLENQLKQKDVNFLFNTKVINISKDKILITDKNKLNFHYLFNCAGAFADKIAKYCNLDQQYRLLPFKGLYWKLTSQAKHKVNTNIYPVPNMNVPFLGVHFTRNIFDDVFIGPTAMPALSRENYSFLQGIHLSELFPILNELFHLYLKNQHNFRYFVHQELKKYRKTHFMKSARSLLPSLSIDDLEKSPKVGIRPQLINIKTHQLVFDFILEKNQYSMHVLNAISPAFTSSFALAKHIVDESNF